jgi:site-specific DNA recombinase
MRATIYARISSDREGAGLGVQSQEADCRTLADTLGWSIVSVHTDNDVSAYSGKPRPGYRAMLEEIAAGKVDAVLAWHTDRLHRSITELEEYASLCDLHGVATHTVKAGHIDLATPSGRLVARQLGSVARYEVEHMVERTKRAKLRAASSGTWKGGRRPFGYADDGVTVIPMEADMVAKGTTAVLAGGSLRGVARAWNKAGTATTTGNPWDASKVRRVLLRPRNAGLMEHLGEVIGQAEWPAIVSEEQWRAVVAVLTDPVRRTTTGSARKWLGSGLYRCGVCDATVVGTRVNKRHSYRCRAGHVTRTLADVDDYVRKIIAARLRRPDAADLLAAAARTDIDTRALEDRAVTLRSRLDELAALFAQGAIDAQQLTGGTRELNSQLDAIRSRIGEAFGGSAMAGIAGTPDPGAAWLDAPLDRQRAVLNALATITLVKGAGGRPHGWHPGQSYFRADLVDIKWRQP